MAEGERTASSRVFISYRREDAAGFVRALLGPLRERFGADRIFKDTDNIPPGQDFLNVIEHELTSCKVLLAVIGNEWMTVTDARTKKHRLDNPADTLRVEIAAALRNGNITVIPVLVDHAGMPAAEDLPEDLRPIARRNAFELSDSRWDTDVRRLIEAIEKICADPAPAVPVPPGAPGPGGPAPPVPDSGAPDFVERLAVKRKRQVADHVKVAKEAWEGRDLPAVLAACERAMWLDPQDPDARELAARAQTAIDEQEIEAQLTAAQAALGKGDLAAASEAIDQVLARRPNHQAAVKLRQDLLQIRGERERQRETDRLVALALKGAQTSLDEGDFTGAQSHVDDALALAAESRDALALRATIAAARDESVRRRELKRRAQQTVSDAKAEFAAGQHDAALARLSAFSPPHELVSQALEELQRKAAEAQKAARQEKVEHDAAEAAVQARHDADAALAKATTAFQQKQFAAALELVEAARTPDRTHQDLAGWTAKIQNAKAAEAAAEEDRLERLAQKTLKTEYRPPKPSPWPRAMMPVAAVLLAGILGGGWWLHAHRSPPPPPPPKANFASALAGAEAEFHKKNFQAAIALVRSIPAEAEEQAAALDLLRRIRADAANAASAARRKAQTAGASAESSFRDGESSQGEAEKLQRPEDTERAIALFQAAERAFDLASSAALTPVQLMAEAKRLKGIGNLAGAIDYALRALTRSPQFQPAMQFLGDQRRESLRRARDAHDRAKAAGATDTSPLLLAGRRQEEEAATHSAPADTLLAIAAYDGAAASFAKAYDAAIALRAANDQAKAQRVQEAVGHVARATQMLESGNLAGARSEISAARTADPANGALDGLDKRLADLVSAAAKAREASDKAAQDEQRITRVLAQSKAQSDEDAVVTLQALQPEFPNDNRIKQELSARIKIAPPPPPADERPAIAKVLNDFAAAYSRRDTAAIQAVWPTVGTTFRDTFSSFRQLNFGYESQVITPGPGRAGVTASQATATAVCRVSISQTDTRGREIHETRTKQFMLEKSAGAWRIVAYTDVTK